MVCVSGHLPVMMGVQEFVRTVGTVQPIKKLISHWSLQSYHMQKMSKLFYDEESTVW